MLPIIEFEPTQPGSTVIDSDDLLLPAGARLLHIGPPKTGTTAIQAALHGARPVLREHGVIYPGEARQHFRGALAIAGKRRPDGSRQRHVKHWRELVDQVQAAGDNRVIISSEFFSEGDEADVRNVVEGLGGERVHVVVTLRPLTSILPSAWQQYVRNRLRTSYTRWLDGVFNSPPEVAARMGFWRRHSHDELVARWASVVGPERMTVIVVDERDRTQLLRVFERLTGLPDGLLVPAAATENRSLTRGEIEMIRHVNQEFYRRRVPIATHFDIIVMSVVRAMQSRRPARNEARTVTPEWAVERATERGAQFARRIRDLGVRVVGNIEDLAARPSASDRANEAGQLPSGAAAHAVLAAARAAAKGVPDLVEGPTDEVDRRAVGALGSGELIRLLAGRATGRVGRGVLRMQGRMQGRMPGRARRRIRAKP